MTEHLDDIDQWWDELAGRELGRGPHTELQTLRRVIHVEAASQNVGGDAEAEARALERLMFRLRRERMEPRRRLLAWSFALAATLSAVAVGLFLLRQPETSAPELIAYNAPPTWRGAYAHFEVREVKPREGAERFAAALRAEGLQADIYASGLVFTVETELPNHLSPSLVERYKELGLTVEKPGLVRVDFKP